nr:enoyl-CoA hydratase/isomerase family protein [Myxococcota bacterium]
MSETAPLIDETREDEVVILTFNDPPRRNAMTKAMGEAFRDKIAELEGDTQMRAVVLTGSGTAFSAGGDLDMISGLADKAHAGNARDEVRDFMRDFYGLFLSVRNLPVPTLAAINGHAIGAGL